MLKLSSEVHEVKTHVYYKNNFTHILIALWKTQISNIPINLPVHESGECESFCFVYVPWSKHHRRLFTLQ